MNCRPMSRSTIRRGSLDGDAVTAPADQPSAAFFNRERELAILDRAWQARGAQLVTLWGRRRVGKSALLARFAAGKRTVYLYGTRASEAALLGALARQASAVSGDRYFRYEMLREAQREIASGKGDWIVGVEV